MTLYSAQVILRSAPKCNCAVNYVILLLMKACLVPKTMHRTSAGPRPSGTAIRSTAAQSARSSQTALRRTAARPPRAARGISAATSESECRQNQAADKTLHRKSLCENGYENTNQVNRNRAKQVGISRTWLSDSRFLKLAGSKARPDRCFSAKQVTRRAIRPLHG